MKPFLSFLLPVRSSSAARVAVGLLVPCQLAYASLRLWAFARLRLAARFACFFAFAACGGSEAPTLAQVQAEIFTPSCAFGACHSARSRQGELVLEPGVAYENLVSAAPDLPAARDRGLLRVSPGKPLESFVLLKVRAPLDADLGTVMPQGTEGLEPERARMLEAWIAAGAPRE